MQIAIAQDQADEAALLEWAAAHAPVNAWRRTLESATAQPAAPGDVRQVLLPLGAEPDIAPVRERDEAWHVRPGTAIEWNRTTEREPELFLPGRLYLRSDADPALQRVYLQLSGYLRRSASERSVGRHPIYVAPSLASRVSAGAARLIHAGGSSIELLPADRPDA